MAGCSLGSATAQMATRLASDQHLMRVRSERAVKGIRRLRSRWSQLKRRPQGSGLVLMYAADRRLARPGETVVFTAWVINETGRCLKGVRLVPGSLTNEALDVLQFLPLPRPNGQFIGRLGKFETAYRSFSYLVTARDQLNDGELLSGMRVIGRSAFREFHDEHDAVVAVRG